MGSSSPRGVAVCVMHCCCHSVLMLSLGGDLQTWGLAGCVLNWWTQLTGIGSWTGG